MAFPVAHDQFHLPDLLRPEQMPSLPAWVVLRGASLTTVVQRDPNTRLWRAAPTLPAKPRLTEMERDLLTRHILALQDLTKHQTPATDPAAEQQMLIMLTKLMMSLPSPIQNDLGAEAKGEAFLTALDDFSVWVVQAAIRSWYRG